MLPYRAVFVHMYHCRDCCKQRPAHSCCCRHSFKTTFKYVSVAMAAFAIIVRRVHTRDVCASDGHAMMFEHQNRGSPALHIVFCLAPAAQVIPRCISTYPGSFWRLAHCAFCSSNMVLHLLLWFCAVRQYVVHAIFGCICSRCKLSTSCLDDAGHNETHPASSMQTTISTGELSNCVGISKDMLAYRSFALLCSFDSYHVIDYWLCMPWRR